MNPKSTSVSEGSASPGFTSADLTDASHDISDQVRAALAVALPGKGRPAQADPLPIDIRRTPNPHAHRTVTVYDDSLTNPGISIFGDGESRFLAAHSYSSASTAADPAYRVDSVRIIRNGELIIPEHVMVPLDSGDVIHLQGSVVFTLPAPDEVSNTKLSAPVAREATLTDFGLGPALFPRLDSRGQPAPHEPGSLQASLFDPEEIIAVDADHSYWHPGFRVHSPHVVSALVAPPYVPNSRRFRLDLGDGFVSVGFVPVGQSEVDRRPYHILQQHSPQSGGYAAAAMLLLDGLAEWGGDIREKGRPIQQVLELLAEGIRSNRSSDLTELIHLLSGPAFSMGATLTSEALQVSRQRVSPAALSAAGTSRGIALLKNIVKEKGPSLVGLSHAFPEQVGRHFVIVDRFSATYLGERIVTLRDPYHGWRISVTEDAFIKRVPHEVLSLHMPAAERFTFSIRSTAENVFVVRGFPKDQELALGRDASTDGPYILIPHEAVSRRHARLRWSPSGGVEVSDAGSRNGTTLDGLSVTPHSGWIGIVPGQKLNLGRSVTIELLEQPAADTERMLQGSCG